MSVQSAVRPSLTLKRRLKAPPAQVFAAWTDPEKLKRWMAPGQFATLGAACDPRVGGRYRIEMRSPDGKAHDVGGVYREVIANEKLVFTWQWDVTPPDQPYESLVTVLFKADGDGTLLTLMHEQLFDEPSRDGHQAGWNGVLDKLEKFVA
jgi:uncharacterized protein YndB with AHSA1/START domain